MTTLLLLALALSMDAFAAAVSRGAAAWPHPGLSGAVRVGLAFGAAQALMPLIGWLLGVAFTSIIREIDHWIAFVLLAFIGIRMVDAGSRTEAEPQVSHVASGSGWGLPTAALATSIDAAAAGVALPMLGLPVLLACAIIGAVTFIMSSAGVFIGAAAGALVGRRAEVAGGLVLIGIGTKILIDHVFFGG